MKTKELIRLLNKEDPTGEEEVCVGNIDILFPLSVPAYYDGALQVLERNENGEIIGGKFKRIGRKIQIYTLPISDALVKDENFKIDYSELSESKATLTKQHHEQLKTFYKNMLQRHELEDFQAWFLAEAKKLTQDLDIDSIKRQAKVLFERDEISYLDKLPGDGKIPMGKSYCDVRKEQWASRYEINIKDGFIGYDVKLNNDGVQWTG